jgi:hypothetical protein
MSSDDESFEFSHTPDNFVRGDRGRDAVQAYCNATGVGATRDVLEYDVSDLMADMLHYVQREGWSIELALDKAAKHYGSDVVELAFANDDSWANPLGDPTNVPKAILVLKASGVPERYWQGVLVYVGLAPPETDEEGS